jgi:membrane protease YdiL (CAAX protease family)
VHLDLRCQGVHSPRRLLVGRWTPQPGLGPVVDGVGVGSNEVLFTGAAAAAIVVWALCRGSPLWRSDMAILLPLYPVWGTIQQVIFQGLLHRRLRVLLPNAILQVLLTSTAFAFVHWGNPALVALTFAAGIAWSLLFRRWPNVWALGLSHGILAALAYPMILGDAPLERM